MWMPTVDSVNQRQSRAEMPEGATPPMWAAVQDDLRDLGMEPDQLLELAGREGMLPTEALAEIAQRAGCADALESVR